MAEEKEKTTEQKGTYYSECDWHGDKTSFTMKCKKGKPAVRIQAEKSED